MVPRYEWLGIRIQVSNDPTAAQPSNKGRYYRNVRSWLLRKVFTNIGSKTIQKPPMPNAYSHPRQQGEY